MNGMTKKEFATFKQIKAFAACAQVPYEIIVVKRMVSDWIMQGKTETIRARRRMASNAIRHAHSHHPDFDTNRA